MDRFLLGLKHWFIPHPGNDHQPHFLRDATAAVLILLAIAAEGALIFHKDVLIPHSTFLGEILSSVLVDETNQNRAADSLNVLAPNWQLEAAARAKAEDMAAKGYFAHTSPEGRSPWYWFDLIGYHYSYAGENLAVNFTDSADVTNAWMNSPGHRANILNSHYTEIGIASAHGTYQGHDAIFVVQLFGRPSGSAIPVAAASPNPPLAQAPVPAANSGVLSASTPAPKPAPIVKKQIAAAKPAAPAPVPSQANAIVVEDASVPTSTTAAAPAAQTPATESGSTAIAAIVANPSRTVDALALMLIIISLVAIVLKLYHMGLAHPRLVMNGALMVIVLAGVISLNRHFFEHAKVF